MTDRSSISNNASSQQFDDGPWYKQSWAWFVLTPLIVVVLVSAMLVTVAVKFGDERVIDNYYKEGRLINHRLEQDQAAESLGLAADVKFDRLVGEVFITLSADNSSEPLPEKLLLLLSHPTTAKQDRSVEMKKLGPGRYRGDLESKLDYHWYLRLLPELTQADAMERYNEVPWRLTGEIFFRKESQVALTPAKLSSAQ